MHDRERSCRNECGNRKAEPHEQHKRKREFATFVSKPIEVGRRNGDRDQEASEVLDNDPKQQGAGDEGGQRTDDGHDPCGEGHRT